MTPVRRGVPKYLTLEFDAAELLVLLAPGPKGQGRLLSHLLRMEAARREERAAYVASGVPPWTVEDDE